MANNRILVIDDTSVVRIKIREMLPPGFEIIEANDGLQGYNLILEEKFNLIILDFLLPKMSGWEIFHNIQVKPELRKIPLVIMSGSKEEVTEKLVEPFEYFEFLGKPFDKTQLVNAIKSAIAKSKKGQQGLKSPQFTLDVKGVDSLHEIKSLNDKIVKMQLEIDGLKKQVNQIVAFIKQKIK
ncbi:response regulator [Dolichospermum circinale CS-1225]|uniref:response regulator n=1 Tax=Dolichospermum circinale TaxID=109265 RepID=UPI00232F2394|nr:response regulator [Dolichospermum circinale]MDB9521079.1 response regulator [Dolichospermum circinale CS-1225]